MLVSELSFPHLQAAREARLADELELRRVVHERFADVATPRTRRDGVGLRSSERMPRARLGAIGSRAGVTCTD